MSKWKWRQRGRIYALKARMWKLRLSIYKDIAHAKYLGAKMTALRVVHYATGGRPVVVEPELDDMEDNADE